MKQIGNWVFGSFFRTIGRILVFVLLGFIIARFVDFGDIKDNFDIADLLGIEKIDALTVTENVKNSGSGYFTINNENDFIQYNDFYYTTISSGWIDRSITFNFKWRINSGNNDYIEFPFIAAMPSQTEINYPVQDDFVTCRTWTCDTYSQGECGQFKCISWYTSGTSTVNDHLMTDYEVNSLSFYAAITFVDSEGNWAGWKSCSVNGNSFICPMYHDLWVDSIKVVINYNPPKSSQWYFGLMRGYNIYRGQDIQNAVEQNTQAINQQTQQQQQNHEETQNYLEDTNSTSTENSANNFFGNFTTTDSGGLSSIITAPLVMVNKMLDGQCVMPSATWKGATISLPCGDMLWSRPGASDLKNLLNVFYGGFICYYAIRKLFLMIEGMKDPTSDRIEVSDL